MDKKTTQLRRYEVEKGRLTELADWFPTIAAVREKYGFTIEFAYADEESSEFIWAVSYPGNTDDFDKILAVYNDSPDRAAAFAGFESPVKNMHLSFVNTI